jgi:hypothetical protein
VLPALGAATTIAVATQLEATALLGGAAALVIFTIYSLVKHRAKR